MFLPLQDVMKMLQLIIALFCVYSRSSAQQPGTDRGNLPSGDARQLLLGKRKRFQMQKVSAV